MAYFTDDAPATDDAPTTDNAPADNAPASEAALPPAGGDVAGAPAEAAPADASMWGRMVRGVKSALGIVGETRPDVLAGYVGIWLQGDQAHITEIAVRDALRGRGIGELLLIGTVRVAFEQGMDEVTLEARVSNFIAQRLYDKYGLQRGGHPQKLLRRQQGGRRDNDYRPHLRRRLPGEVCPAARAVPGTLRSHSD